MNIPIGMGTSGHMVGAALVAIVFGSPWAGVLVLTLVLLVQGFAFADGGITTMGANILNMGIVSGFVGYYTYAALRKSVGTSIAAFGGAWLGLFISAMACAVQMWLAGTFPLVPGLIAMGTYHLIIGFIGEGLITAVVITAIAKSRPDLLEDSFTARSRRSLRRRFTHERKIKPEIPLRGNCNCAFACGSGSFPCISQSRRA